MGKLLLILWIAAALWLCILSGPPNDPPSAPAGVGTCRGYPVSYAHPAPLSARVGQHSGPVHENYDAPPWPDDGLTTADDEPLSYTERFSHEAIGPDWAWAEAACLGICPVASAAVLKQGVGE